MAPPPARRRWWRHPAALVAAIGLVVMCWIVGNPRSSGPDEASHMVAAAGLVRGDRDGVPDPLNPGFRLIDVPSMTGEPNPACWSQTFDPAVPVVCANDAPLSTETRAMATTSYNYPPWALVLPGLASFTPSASSFQYLARMASSLIPVLLLGAALLAARGQRTMAAAAALLGLTPIAWFTFGIVNPSAVAIAGGLALWIGLLFERQRVPLLTLAGWACVLLPRRDGPVWATLTVLAACWLMAVSPADVWRRLPRPAQAIAGALALVPVLTTFTSGERGFNLALAVAPLALVAAAALHTWASRLAAPHARRWIGVGVAAAIATGVVVAVLNRPGGNSAETTRLVLASTGRHLQQLVGNLGWLSTPVPVVGVYLFWAMVGGLALVAVLEFRRAAVVYAGALATAVAVAWIMELGQGASYGEYWQGRYTMPFAVGFPLLLVWRPSSDSWLIDRLARIVGWSSWLILNVAFVSAQQRWAVGRNGSWYPWDWDTWGAPVAPWLLLLIHAATTAALVVITLDSPHSEPST